MSIFRRKKQTDAETESLKSFLDMIAPSIVKFETGYYICGNTFRCIWALREYPTSTDDLAILRHLGEKHGVTLHIYTRMVSPLEERKIVHNAEIRNRMNRGSAQDLQRSVEAESNLQDVANLIGSLHRNKEPLLHCAVYIEMIAGDMQELQIFADECGGRAHAFQAERGQAEAPPAGRLLRRQPGRIQCAWHRV